MLMLIYFALLSTVSCNGVYRFSQEPIEDAPKLRKINGKIIYCPDDQTQCFDDQTCCQLSDNSYGCCPLPSAVCCSDHQHCCPKNTKCNLSAGTCDSVNNKVVTTLKLKVPAIKTKIICPGGEAQCGNDQTCCQLPDGSYGCCPLPSAVCCSDHKHCCPKGTKCNLSAESCDSVNNKVITTLKLKVPAIKTKIICPDGQTQCGSDQTCCQLPDGSSGCCPLPSAVCCSDHQHCCPKGTKCNLSEGTCDSVNNKVVTTLKLKVPAMKTKIICPDGKSQCGDQETCCPSQDGSYVCCQAIKAVCCSDHQHCCPENTVCNLINGTCDGIKITRIPLLKNKIQPVLKMKSNICPDGQSQCDDGYTCCLNAYGSFGCCLGVNSVCCSDKMHCCPENTVCNVPNGTCDSVRKSQIFSIKPKTKESIVKHTSCPDGSPCEEGYTCCPMVDNTYGCCSYTDAVCCSDHSHCCPSGTTCSLNTKTCDKNFFQYIFNRPIRRP